mgnify:FL=1
MISKYIYSSETIKKENSIVLFIIIVQLMSVITVISFVTIVSFGTETKNGYFEIDEENMILTGKSIEIGI